jgi:hypothetical protein
MCPEVNPEEGKIWWRSKGLLLGAVAIAVAVVGSSMQGDFTWQAGALAGLGAATGLIRAITTEKIIWRSK